MNKIKIILTIILLFGLVYIKNDKVNIPINVSYDLSKEHNIYLLNDDNYISKVITYFDSSNITDEIIKRINILKEPNIENFYGLIPKNTKINKLEIKEDNVYIDFSNEILDVNKYVKDKMIEAIVYSLTEINGINNIYLSVNNKEIAGYNYPLTRNIGINKKYDINNLNEITEVTVYYNRDDYYIPITKVVNLNIEKIEIIIEELKNNNFDNNLDKNVMLEKYSINDDRMDLVFNNYIFSDTETSKILEEVKYCIASSIFDNYNVNEVVFNGKDMVKRKN